MPKAFLARKKARKQSSINANTDNVKDTEEFRAQSNAGAIQTSPSQVECGQKSDDNERIINRSSRKHKVGSKGHDDNVRESTEHQHGDTGASKDPPIVVVWQEDEDHSMKKLFVCIYCNKQFSTGYQLKRHLASHSGQRRYVCGVCKAAFVLSSSLSHHMRSHTGNKDHVCAECGQAFSRSSALAAHKKTHSTSKDHTCTICGKSFHQKGNLVSHVNAHKGIKPFPCRKCSKAFSQLSNLKDHMWRAHQEKKIFSCCSCSEAFERRRDLRDHERLTHSADVTLATGIPEDASVSPNPRTTFHLSCPRAPEEHSDAVAMETTSWCQLLPHTITTESDKPCDNEQRTMMKQTGHATDEYLNLGGEYVEADFGTGSEYKDTTPKEVPYTTSVVTAVTCDKPRPDDCKEIVTMKDTASLPPNDTTHRHTDMINTTEERSETTVVCQGRIDRALSPKITVVSSAEKVVTVHSLPGISGCSRTDSIQQKVSESHQKSVSDETGSGATGASLPLAMPKVASHSLESFNRHSRYHSKLDIVQNLERCSDLLPCTPDKSVRESKIVSVETEQMPVCNQGNHSYANPVLKSSEQKATTSNTVCSSLSLNQVPIGSVQATDTVVVHTGELASLNLLDQVHPDNHQEPHKSTLQELLIPANTINTSSGEFVQLWETDNYMTALRHATPLYVQSTVTNPTGSQATNSSALTMLTQQDHGFGLSMRTGLFDSAGIQGTTHLADSTEISQNYQYPTQNILETPLPDQVAGNSAFAESVTSVNLVTQAETIVSGTPNVSHTVPSKSDTRCSVMPVCVTHAEPPKPLITQSQSQRYDASGVVSTSEALVTNVIGRKIGSDTMDGAAKMLNVNTGNTCPVINCQDLNMLNETPIATATTVSSNAISLSASNVSQALKIFPSTSAVCQNTKISGTIFQDAIPAGRPHGKILHVKTSTNLDKNTEISDRCRGKSTRISGSKTSTKSSLVSVQSVSKLLQDVTVQKEPACRISGSTPQLKARGSYGAVHKKSQLRSMKGSYGMKMTMYTPESATPKEFIMKSKPTAPSGPNPVHPSSNPVPGCCTRDYKRQRSNGTRHTVQSVRNGKWNIAVQRKNTQNIGEYVRSLADDSEATILKDKPNTVKTLLAANTVLSSGGHYDNTTRITNQTLNNGSKSATNNPSPLDMNGMLQNLNNANFTFDKFLKHPL